MAMITILGGTGFVGSALATRLVAAGRHRVRVLTRDPARGRHLSVLPGVELLRANVHDAAALTFERPEIETLVIAADLSYHAAKVYEAVGFRPTEHLVAVIKKPAKS